MAEVVLFHHVQGLTDGVRAFAAALEEGGHTVHTPDLFDGERPETLDDGLAQTTSGARGALLYESCISLTEDWSFGLWPDGLPVQIHGMDHDPYFADEGDLDAAKELVAIVGPHLAELFTYPGDKHLFTDSSLPSYDPGATALVIRRSVEFLDKIDNGFAG